MTKTFFTSNKGMDAMQAPRTLYLLAVMAAVTGCRSGGSTGWSAWNPFSRWGQNTAVADAAPELPSQQFADASKSPATKSSTATAGASQIAGGATTSAPTYTPPAAIARAASATPTARSNTVSSAPAYTPPTNSGVASISPTGDAPASSAPSASMAASGPYDPNGYRAVTSSSTSASTPGVNRYGMPDRYAAAAASSTPAMPSDMPAPSTQYPGGDRYATYETPNVAPPSTTGAPPETTAPQVEQAAATVNLTTPPGQYRPAGTSSYSMTSSEQVNVASLPEKPAAAPPTTPSPAGSTPAYPATGTPEPGSIYGVPAYR